MFNPLDYAKPAQQIKRGRLHFNTFACADLPVLSGFVGSLFAPGIAQLLGPKSWRDDTTIFVGLSSLGALILSVQSWIVYRTGEPLVRRYRIMGTIIGVALTSLLLSACASLMITVHHIVGGPATWPTTTTSAPSTIATSLTP